jgi:aspartyl-tRNA(Asn)/glutamyl-tRNA(Gln) amidotransferase subunit A
MASDRSFLLGLDAAQLHAGYRAGSLDPREVTEVMLAAAAQARGRYAAVVSLNAEDARQAASVSAVRWRANQPLSALDGVPITFKDSFHVRDLPRWHGSAVNEGTISEHDAAPVERAREAGLVIIGKTSMPDYGLLMSGLSSQAGVVRNPWDIETNPAGSSAGAAACLACGVGALAVGTDMVGSVRLPAAACGVVSLYATQGRVAYDPPGSYRGAGPMARSVADVAALLEEIGQHDSRDQYALPGQFRFDWQAVRVLRGKRIALLKALSYGDSVDQVTARAVARQAEVLSGLGADIHELADLHVDADDYGAIYGSMLHRGLADWHDARAEQRERVQPEIGHMLQAALTDSGLKLDQMTRRLGIATSRLMQQLAPFDYVLSPALPIRSFPATAISPSPHLGAMSHMGFACWFNQLGRPAGTVPVLQIDRGVCPVSVQVAGRRFDDVGVLQIMRLLERERGFTIDYPILDLNTAPQGACP